jgi:hypothetical protein
MVVEPQEITSVRGVEGRDPGNREPQRVAVRLARGDRPALDAALAGTVGYRNDAIAVSAELRCQDGALVT